MSENSFEINTGATRPNEPIEANEDAKSIVLPANWKENLNAALPKAHKKLDFENKEATKTVNVGYMFIGGLFISIAIFLLINKWQRI